MNKHFKGVSFFIKLCWGYSKLFISLLFVKEILQICTTLFMIVAPRYLLDELFGNRDVTLVIYYTAAIVGVTFLLNQIINFLKLKTDNLKENVRIAFELDFCKRHMESDYIQLENPDFYNNKTLANNYINGQWNEFGKILDIAFSIFRKIGMILGILSIMFSLNAIILIIFLGLAIVNLVVNSKLKSKRMAVISTFSPIIRRRAYFEDVTTNLTFAKEIRIGGLFEWIVDKYKSYMDVFCGKTSEIYGLDVVSKNTYNITNVIQQILTYAYLLYGVVKLNYTLGQFTMYFNAINIFNSSVNEVIDSALELNQYNTYYEAFKKYNETQNFDREGTKEIDFTRKDKVFIEFRDVSFKYPGQSNYALENINVKIMENKKISIVGENGAGKSTFIKLMARLYKPTSGTILLNGVDINEYDYVEYLKLFSVIFQDYKLFEMSLKENICLNESELCIEEDLKNILSEIGLFDRINLLVSGLDTTLGKKFDEKGVDFSGGERQRVAIARALYLNKPIVILDEPTSDLDPRAEYELYKNFDKITNHKTAFYISHRLSSAKFCDEILVFEKGTIVEIGSHEELMSKDRLYAELFNMQAQFYV